jgi:small-conductance mechanosensitive channel
MRLRYMIIAATTAGWACAPFRAAGSSQGLRNLLPDALRGGSLGDLQIWQWVGLLAGAVAVYPVSLGLGRLLLSFARRLSKFTPFNHDDHVIEAGRGPLGLLLFSLLLAALTRWLAFPGAPQYVADVVARSAGIVSAAWFVLRFLKILAGWILLKIAEDSPDDPARVRGVRTQVTMLRRVLTAATVVIAVAMALLQFEVVRSVGVSLLASAGIAAMMLGLAAKETLSTLLAGIQISITQPIRIGDTVVVEKEEGVVEEVHLTYVVLEIGNQRRLVVPISYFLEKPFQNWSKVTADFLGTVEIRADYTTDVDAVRTELKRILEGEGKALWDGKAQRIKVSDATEKVMTLRAVVGAQDAGKLSDLQCLVREKLIAFMSAHPDWLPVARNEMCARPEDANSNGKLPLGSPRNEDRAL